MNTRFTLDHESLRRERRGETVDRSRLTVQVLAGPNDWHDQRMGLEGLAIEVVAHRLRSEGLTVRDKLSEEDKRNEEFKPNGPRVFAKRSRSRLPWLP